ncbi:hypothetical protein NQ317_012370 [Molorchus minor]|uniref:Mitochondrial carrier protein n=1 Tax=Molorchus minor TaxID=1323400 RepID=A0ABQ9JPZ4_9CUCU|nr:hypothetical protein NQ317_012370 [Molorchus minor]
MVSGGTEAIHMPFERIQTLLADQKYHNKFKNTFDALKSLRHYGFKEYYRGFSVVISRNTLSHMTYFTFKDKVLLLLPEPRNTFHRSVNNFLSGALTGCVYSMVFFPWNVTRVAVQSKLGGKFDNPFTALKMVYKSRGGKITRVYHGAPVNCLKAFMGWGIATAAYEQCRIALK